MRTGMRLFMVLAVAFSMAWVAGCAPSKSGAVKEDTTLTGTSKELAKTTTDVEEYQGPKLRVGVVNERRLKAKLIEIRKELMKRTRPR